MSRRLMLAALAAGAAAACNPGRVPTVAEERNALADSADQIMFKIKTVLTDRGLMRAELTADTAYFFDDNARIELRDVHTTFYTNTGQKSSVLTSREGTYNTRAQETEARKNVVVLSEDGKRLETPQLMYSQIRDEISSDSAFVLTEPTRTLRGVGFTSDPNMRQFRVSKVMPGTTGTFTLPGQ